MTALSMTPGLLTLTEFQPETGVRLGTAERDLLRKLVPSLTIAPSAGHDGHYDLTPGSWVGAVTIGNLAVEIRPKLPIGQVLFLISYALDPRAWSDEDFSFESEPSLQEAIIPAFVAHVRRALRRGVLQGYRSEEAALATVRGRIRVEDQIRDRYGLLPPVEVRYDEFTEDIEENRLLKAALGRLGRLPIRSEAARGLLHGFDGVLQTVRSVEYDPRAVPEIGYTRLNERYRGAVELARLTLRSASFELRHGRETASAFLVDMNRVFEDFVVVALRDALGLSEHAFPQGAKGRRLRLDQDGRVKLEPDLSWWDGSSCTFVGDVKYKRANAAGVVHPDLYQLLAYTVAAGLPGGLLLYAAGEEEPALHHVVNVGKRLEIMALDLRGSPQAILAQVASAAYSIRALSRLAVAS